MDRVFHEWRQRVAAEYRSAALTSQVVHWMILAALPEAVVVAGLQVVQDELEHARGSYDCLVALRGDPGPTALDPAILQTPAPDGILAALVDSVVEHLCLGETLAVPLFAAMRRHARHPAVVALLDRILRDEARHRQFGWDALDALIALDPAVVEHVTRTLPPKVADLQARYAPSGAEAEPLTDDERAAGLLPLSEFRRIVHSTVTGELTRRFEARGIGMPVAEAEPARG